MKEDLRKQEKDQNVRSGLGFFITCWSGVGSWTSNLTSAGSIPVEFDSNVVLVLKNVE